MDPISAVGLLASISSLADGAFNVVSFINTIREGGKQRLRLFTELNSLWMILKLLEGISMQKMRTSVSRGSEL